MVLGSNTATQERKIATSSNQSLSVSWPRIILLSLISFPVSISLLLETYLEETNKVMLSKGLFASHFFLTILFIILLGKDVKQTDKMIIRSGHSDILELKL